MGKQWKQWLTLLWGTPKSLQMVTAAMKLKDTCSLEEKLWPTWIAYSKAETLLCQRSLSSQSYGFSDSHIWMWELDYEESWVLNNGCFWTVVLEKTLESPLDYKEIKPVNPKEISSEYSLERLMLKLKLQYFGHLMWRGDSFIGKDPDAGKIEGRKWRGWQRMRLFGGITDWMDMSLSKLWESRSQRGGHDWVTEWNSTEVDCKEIKPVNLNGNQSWIFIGRTDTEIETPILWPPDARADSEKTLMLGKIEDRRRRGRQRMRWLDGITNSVDLFWASSGSWWWTRNPGVPQSKGSQRVGHNWVTELNCSSAFLVILRVFPISQPFTPEIVRESVF